jgi:hypothetical protein
VATLFQRIADRLFRKPPAHRTAAQSVPTGQRGRSLAYAPDLDGDADPGEIVWTWVRFEDDPARGKDRRRAAPAVRMGVTGHRATGGG